MDPPCPLFLPYARAAQPIRKMTQKFARNPAVDADADVARRVFHVLEGRIHVDYHFGTNRWAHHVNTPAACRTHLAACRTHHVNIPAACRTHHVHALQPAVRLRTAHERCS
jgi:hypothetical protein